MKTTLLGGIFSSNWYGRNKCATVAGFLIFSLVLAPLARAQSQSDWKAEWDKTVEAAKKEGRLVIYHGSDTERIFAVFQKKYPEIKFVSVTGPPAPAGSLLVF